jgi:hypothetical protein
MDKDKIDRTIETLLLNVSDHDVSRKLKKEVRRGNIEVLVSLCNKMKELHEKANVINDKIEELRKEEKDIDYLTNYLDSFMVFCLENVSYLRFKRKDDHRGNAVLSENDKYNGIELSYYEELLKDDLLSVRPTGILPYKNKAEIFICGYKNCGGSRISVQFDSLVIGLKYREEESEEEDF